jgi:copper resistance protein B
MRVGVALALTLIALSRAASAMVPSASSAAMMDMNDTESQSSVLIDQLELRAGEGETAGAWQGEAWYGGDYDKLWIRSEGLWPAGEGASGRAEVLWDRIVSRWWSLQAGARYDAGGGPGRGWGAIGLEGLAPYWFDVQATLYVGEAGRFATRVLAERDLLLTQRLILQPEAELNAYTRADPARALGAGLTNLEAALRMRYEVRRELAPYLGVGWISALGESGRLEHARGLPSRAWQMLLGVRAWF